MADLLTDLSSCKKPSKAAQLRAALPEIDIALAAGYTHLEILNGLNKRGLDISFTVYQTTLFRIRKPSKRKNNAPTATAQAQKITAQALPAAKNGNSKQTFEFNPIPSDNLWK